MLAVVKEANAKVLQPMATIRCRRAVLARQLVDLLPNDAAAFARHVAMAVDRERAAEADLRAFLVEADRIRRGLAFRLRLRRVLRWLLRTLLAAVVVERQHEHEETDGKQQDEQERALHPSPPRWTMASQSPFCCSSSSITSRTAPKPPAVRVVK